MATVTEEKFLETTTVLTEEESAELEAVLDADPEPPTEKMMAAFRMAAEIKQDC